MGFLDALGKVAEATVDAGEFVGSLPLLAVDLATAPIPGGHDFGDVWSSLKSSGDAQPTLDYAGRAVGPTIEGMEIAWREGVSRPVTTAVAVASAAGFNPLSPLAGVVNIATGKADPRAAFSGAAWRNAYNLTGEGRLSPGQAYVTSFASAVDPESQAAFRGAVSGEGAAAFDRVRDEAWFGTASIPFDFGLRWFADPTVIGGKIAKAARLRHIDIPFTGNAAQREEYLASPRYDDVKSYILDKVGPTPRTIGEVYDLPQFRRSPEGPAAAAALLEAKTPEQLALTFRVLMSDYDAIEPLGRQNKALAGQLGRLLSERSRIIAVNKEPSLFWLDDAERQAFDAANGKDRIGVLTAEIDEVVGEQQSLMRLVGRTGLEGLEDGVGDTGLVGALTHLPRVPKGPTAAQFKRSAFYQRSIFGAPFRLTMGMRPHQMVDLNRPDSAIQIERTLDQGKVRPEVRERILDGYSRAIDAPERFSHALGAQAAALRQVFSDAGISVTDQATLIEKAAKGTSHARAKIAEKKFDGERRAIVQDPDTGTLVEMPLMKSQTADWLPAVDIDEARRIIRRYKHEILQAADLGLRLPDEVLSRFYKLWKPGTLFRLGWPIRVVTDEQLRIMAEVGVMTQLKYLTRGVPRWLHNRGAGLLAPAARGALVGAEKRAQRDLSAESLVRLGKLDPDDYADLVSARARTGGEIGYEEATLYENLRAGYLTREDYVQSLVQVAHWRADEMVDDLEGQIVKLRGMASAQKKTVGYEPVKVDDLVFEGARGIDPRNPAIQSSLASSDQGLSSLWQMETAYDRRKLQHSFGSSRSILPSERKPYAEGITRALNLQIGSDEVTRMFLRGKSVDDVLDWLHNKGPGQAYMRSMSRRLRNQDHREWLELLEDHTRAYTLGYDEAIVKATLGKRFDYKMIASRADDELPPVHGQALEDALGKGVFERIIEPRVNQVYRVLGTLPTDTLSRQPYFDEVYRREVQRRGKMLSDAVDKGYVYTANDIGGIQKGAREYALKRVRTLLFDLAEESNLAHYMRFLSPFYMAWQETITRWSGLAYRDPSLVGKANIVWGSPERAGLITDEDGNPVDDPYDVNRSHYITLPIPAPFAGKGPFKTVTDMTFNKAGFNLALNLPGVGPPVTLPVNEIVKTKPEWQEANRFLNHLILPFGATESALSQVLPAWTKRLRAYIEGPDSSREYRNTAIQMFRDRMVLIGQGKMPRPEGTDEQVAQKVWDDVMGDAGKFFLFRTVANLILPVAPGYKSIHQPLIDNYHQLREADPRNADAQFLDENGEAFFWLTGSITRSRDGIPSTLEGWKARKEHNDLIDQYPELGGLTVGVEGAGEFSRAVYTAELVTSAGIGGEEKIRDTMSFLEVSRDPQIRRGWIEYTRFAKLVDTMLENRGLHSLQQSGAADIAELRRAFIAKQGAELPAWLDEFQVFDAGRMRRLLEGARANVDSFEEKGLMDARPDMQGLQEYLLVRGDVRQLLLARKAAGGSGTLAGNSDVAALWSALIAKLTSGNLPFNETYHRYFESDDLQVA